MHLFAHRKYAQFFKTGCRQISYLYIEGEFHHTSAMQHYRKWLRVIGCWLLVAGLHFLTTHFFLKSDIANLLSETEEHSVELGVANHLPCALCIFLNLISDIGNLLSAIPAPCYFPQLSLRVTVWLNTSAPSRLSRSTQK